jgi:hypothetical protein
VSSMEKRVIVAPLLPVRPLKPVLTVAAVRASASRDPCALSGAPLTSSVSDLAHLLASHKDHLPQPDKEDRTTRQHLVVLCKRSSHSGSRARRPGCVLAGDARCQIRSRLCSLAEQQRLGAEAVITEVDQLLEAWQQR